MSLHSNVAGQLDICVHWQQSRITNVVIKNRRPTSIANLFVGKRPTDVLKTLPLIFHICTSAQQVAALEALESASNVEVPEKVTRLRHQLVLLETAKELLLGLCFHYVNSDSLLKSEVVRWHQNAKRHYLPVMSFGAEQIPKIDLSLVCIELENLIANVIGKEASATWAERSVAQNIRLLARLLKSDCINLWQSELLTFSSSTDLSSCANKKQICAALDSENAARFCRYPSLPGEQIETGVWARQRQSDWVLEATQLSVGQIGCRLLAIFYELVKIPKTLIEMADNGLPKSPITGYAQIEAARGNLIHRVILGDSGNVESYAIVAPTEWNFHPNGVLKSLLAGVSVPKESVSRLVEYIIRLVDPCVSWELEVTHA